MKVYFDMDGVLADFDGKVKEISGHYPKEMSSDELWMYINRVPHFFLTLEPIQKGMSLLKEYQDNGYDCEILTAIPASVPTAGEDKIRWARKYLGNNIKVNVVTRKEKKLFCFSDEDVLIDDYIVNIKEWERVGGKGILFKS